VSCPHGARGTLVRWLCAKLSQRLTHEELALVRMKTAPECGGSRGQNRDRANNRLFAGGHPPKRKDRARFRPPGYAWPECSGMRLKSGGGAETPVKRFHELGKLGVRVSSFWASRYGAAPARRHVFHSATRPRQVRNRALRWPDQRFGH
jgi:hypothetical protein